MVKAKPQNDGQIGGKNGKVKNKEKWKANKREANGRISLNVAGDPTDFLSLFCVFPKSKLH